MTNPTSNILIGQDQQRRTRLLQEALQARGLGSAITIDWAELLGGPSALAERISAMSECAVKLDSPGECADVQDALIHRGWQSLGERGTQPRPLAHGEFAHQHLWYAGFTDLLQSLHNATPNARWLNAPSDILRLCDKLACQETLIAAGIDTPTLLGSVDGYAHLRDRMHSTNADRVFVKARYGSSAAGVVAYRCHADGREVAYTSADLVNDGDSIRLFNSLRLRRYTCRNDIETLLDAIAAQGAYAEHWIAKPRAAEYGHFDLRVVSFAGIPRQRIARIASQPMTNLHLGNRRGDAAHLLDDDTMRRLEDSVRRASAVFPKSSMIGFDLIPHAKRIVMLEANAFGDLLPGLHYRGMSTYDDQAAWFAQQDTSKRMACVTTISSLYEIAHA